MLPRSLSFAKISELNTHQVELIELNDDRSDQLARDLIERSTEKRESFQEVVAVLEASDVEVNFEAPVAEQRGK